MAKKSSNLIKMQDDKLKEAYAELDKFIVEMVTSKGLTLMALYYDKAIEGTRTYNAQFCFMPATDKEKGEAQKIKMANAKVLTPKVSILV